MSTALALLLELVAPPGAGPLAPFDTRVGAPCSTSGVLRVCVDRSTDRAESFSVVNRGSPTINPEGDGIYRRWRFELGAHVPDDLRVVIQERSRPEGRDSRISMVTALYVFPRRGVPTLRAVERENGTEVLEARLPTGEAVCFDPETAEVVGGVFSETRPIDTSKRPAGRQFAGLEYTGEGLVIRSDQRGNSPELGGPGRAPAVAIYEGQTCRIRRGLLWDQRHQSLPLLPPTDIGVAQLVAGECGWDLTALAEVEPGPGCGGPAEADEPVEPDPQE